VQVVVAEMDVKAVADVLKTLAELTSTPSWELQHLMSATDTMRRE
jgi:hypothetical protein